MLVGLFISSSNFAQILKNFKIEPGIFAHTATIKIQSSQEKIDTFRFNFKPSEGAEEFLYLSTKKGVWVDIKTKKANCPSASYLYDVQIYTFELFGEVMLEEDFGCLSFTPGTQWLDKGTEEVVWAYPKEVRNTYTYGYNPNTPAAKTNSAGGVAQPYGLTPEQAKAYLKKYKENKK